MAPSIPPAIEATESLSPPMFAATRMASSADGKSVASPNANGTIVSGPSGKQRAATWSARRTGSDARSSWTVRTAVANNGTDPLGHRLSALAAARSASANTCSAGAASIAADTAAAVAAAAAMASEPACVEIEASRAPFTSSSSQSDEWRMPTGATRMAAPQPSCPTAMRAGSAAWWNSHSDLTPGWTHLTHPSISRPMLRCETSRSVRMARATASVRSVSSVVSPIRH